VSGERKGGGLFANRTSIANGELKKVKSKLTGRGPSIKRRRGAGIKLRTELPQAKSSHPKLIGGAVSMEEDITFWIKGVEELREGRNNLAPDRYMIWKRA